MTPSVHQLITFLELLTEQYTSIDTSPIIYSGYENNEGEFCLGIVTNDPLILMFELGEMSYEITEVNIPHDSTDEDEINIWKGLVDILTDCSVNMFQEPLGPSTVVYFPDIKLTYEQHRIVFEERLNDH